MAAETCCQAKATSDDQVESIVKHNCKIWACMYEDFQPNASTFLNHPC